MYISISDALKVIRFPLTFTLLILQVNIQNFHNIYAHIQIYGLLQTVHTMNDYRNWPSDKKKQVRVFDGLNEHFVHRLN